MSQALVVLELFYGATGQLTGEHMQKQFPDMKDLI